MDYCLSLHKTFLLESLPSSSPRFRRHRPFFSSDCATVGFLADHSLGKPLAARRLCANRIRPLVVVASAGASRCEFGSLNTPLELRSPAGKYMIRVLQNFKPLFHVSVEDELKRLGDERDEVVTRMTLSAASDEALLHRRIASMKARELEVAIEDLMYVLVYYRFSEIQVNLLPKLSRCIYNGRLEIWPSKDWELQSIYDLDVLEMIKEHITSLIGLRAKASIADTWAMTNIKPTRMRHIYVASIFYGYFLKSASLRHQLEQRLAIPNTYYVGRQTSLRFPEMCVHGFKNLLSGRQSNVQSVSRSRAVSQDTEKLKRFLTGFDSEALQRCAKLKSKEASNLIDNHCRALFVNEKTDIFETDEEIVTSFLSLKRLILEAVAFGSFLWEAEEYIDATYSLNEI